MNKLKNFVIVLAIVTLNGGAGLRSMENRNQSQAQVTGARLLGPPEVRPIGTLRKPARRVSQILSVPIKPITVISEASKEVGEQEVAADKPLILKGPLPFVMRYDPETGQVVCGQMPD
jgi:hypothetical protein